jgi:predicted nucleic acid-binding protein
LAADRIILDSGALSALAAQKENIRVAVRKAVMAGAQIVVPAPVITETTTGDAGRDAQVNRVMKACYVLPLDEPLARAAGKLHQRKRSVGAIDSMVVACADFIPGTVVITGDVRDLAALASERGVSRIVDLNAG